MNPIYKLAIWSAKCPNCSSTKIRWSHRRNKVEFYISSMLRPVRCEECGQRWFRYKQPKLKSETPGEKTPGDNERSNAE